MEAGRFLSSIANGGFYRQDEECEKNRQSKREQLRREGTSRIRGGGDEEEDADCGLDDSAETDEVPQTFQVEFEIQSGATVQLRGASGFTTPCNVNNGKGVYDISAFCDLVERGRRHNTKDLIRYLLYQYGRMVWDFSNVSDRFGDSEYTISHVALMVAGQEILAHEDSADMSAQLITTFGEYEGGLLEIFVNGEWKQVDTRYRPTLVEGRMWHRVTKVTSGRRYALITYKNTDGNRECGTKYPHLSSGFLR